MKNKLLLTAIVVSFFSYQEVKAQELEVFSASGTQYSSPTATIDFTIGEVVVDSYSNGSHELTQGFNQTNISISNISQLNKVDFNVYPNPTKDWFTIASEEISNVKYEIHSLNGAIILSDQLNDLNTQVNIAQLSSGTYLLVIYSNEKSKTIYKINKIN